MTRHLKRFLSPDFALPLDAGNQYQQLADWLPDEFPGWKPFCQAQFLETSILLPGYILSSQGDRVAMAHSVEARFPFLDHRVVEFAARVPPRWKMKGMSEKYLLKRALGDLVPAQVARRSKQPYRSPDAKSFFTRDWQLTREQYVDELLCEGNLRSAGVFQPTAVQHLLEKVRGGRATGTRDNMALVAILSTQILVDQFVRNFPSGRGTATSLPVVSLSMEPNQASLSS